MHLVPSEVAIGGVYFPPLLLAGAIGVALAAATAFALNRYRLSRFLWYPPVVFLALSALYTLIIGTFLIPA